MQGSHFSQNTRLKCRNILRAYGVRSAYLYGSAATGRLRKNSDIDIAVLFGSNHSREERFKKRLRLIVELSRVFRRDADVVVLDDVRSLLFMFSVISEGKLLYCRNRGEAVEYQCRVMSEYFDFLPTLKAFEEADVKRFAR